MIYYLVSFIVPVGFSDPYITDLCWVGLEAEGIAGLLFTQKSVGQRQAETTADTTAVNQIIQTSTRQ